MKMKKFSAAVCIKIGRNFWEIAVGKTGGQTACCFFENVILWLSSDKQNNGGRAYLYTFIFYLIAESYCYCCSAFSFDFFEYIESQISKIAFLLKYV